MKQKKSSNSMAESLGSILDQRTEQQWRSQISAVAQRYNRDYGQESIELPSEVEAMPIFQDWVSGALAGQIASPFWDLVQPKKNWHCLDMGCGLSFLIYPWRDWNAFFYGQDISSVVCEIVNSRGPQLNSKLFKGMTLAPADQLPYAAKQFDLVLATGVSCYYPIAYWQTVMAAVQQVLKPGGQFVFDVLDPDAPRAENWAILETYLGAEVFLEDLATWATVIKTAKGAIAKQRSGSLFHLYDVRF